MSGIECIAYKSYESGTLQGFANLWIEKMGLEIFGCSLHMQGGKRWINLPSKEYKDKEGQTKFQPILRFRSREHHDKFSEIAKDAIDVWCAAQKEPVAAEQPELPMEGVPF